MFGEHNSVAQRIQAANPKTLVVKCVCHSEALALSHATQLLPEKFEKLIRDVYSYFSCSSKRTKAFGDFQDFFNTKQHKLLKLYDIRWLSLGSCVERLLEQWEALKLYFQDESLTVKNETAKTIFKELCNPYTLYVFCFLKHVCSILNKFNQIFQGSGPLAHRVHRDAVDAYRALVSCFMKPALVRLKPEELFLVDPTSQVNQLPLRDLYMGVHCARLLSQPGFKKDTTPDHLKTTFGLCFQVLVTLAQELKSRLPLDNTTLLFRFLDPQVATRGEIPSLFPLVEKLGDHLLPDGSGSEQLDVEWRNLCISQDIIDLMSGNESGVIPTVEEFWYGVAKREEFAVIGYFSLRILALPFSNADCECERIFSKVNNIKTEKRNKLTVDHVNDLIHIQQNVGGLEDEDGVNRVFVPTQKMRNLFNKDIYDEKK